VSDAFARWRERQALRPPRATPPAAAIAEYKALNYLNRAWTLPLLLLWGAAVIGVVLAFVLYEQDIKAAVPYATLWMVLSFLAVLGSMSFIFFALLRRREWRLYADRLEVSQRPIVWPFGFRRAAVIPLADIAEAAQAELFGGMRVVEITTRQGVSWRLSPGNIGSGRNVRRDDAGFDTFVDEIAETIAEAGLPVPAGERLHTLWDTNLGLGLLGLLVAFGGLLIAGAIYAFILTWDARAGFFGFVGFLLAGMAFDLMRKKLRQRRERS